LLPTATAGPSEPFLSDFRGFAFADINRGVRPFSNRHANRDQFNAIWFDQLEEDTNRAKRQDSHLAMHVACQKSARKSRWRSPHA
jgi:hypothetical protein